MSEYKGFRDRLREWNENKSSVKPEPKPTRSEPIKPTFHPSPVYHPTRHSEVHPKKTRRNIIYSFIVLLAAVLTILLVNYIKIDLTTSFLIVSLITLIAVFFILYLAHHFYQKLTNKLKAELILLLGYSLLILNMILTSRLYSVEWSFLGFALIAMLFYDFKIDSRFLILPAILLLGYVPFLLIGKQNDLAELISIFVYYFLVIGVVLQIIEYTKNISLKLDFEQISNNMIKQTNWTILLTITGILTALIIIANRFYALELYKWTLVYLFVLFLVLFGIKELFKSELI